MKSERPPYLAVKDWDRHQHYKEARPAWIKLYGALLDDAVFLGLPELAQIQLVKLWLLASRMGHPLPNDPKLLAGKIACRGKFYLSALVESGFLLYTNSRESLDDSSGTKTETQQQETERETPVVVGDPKIAGVLIGQPADYGLQITIAANRAVTARWGQQLHPYLHGQSYETAQALIDAGVPLDTAKAAIAALCTNTGRTAPPKSLNWFRPGILSYHQTLEQKALDGPATAPAGDALDRWMASEKAKETPGARATNA